MLTASMKAAGVAAVGAGIDRTTAGGFIAIASNGDLDRDGERIQPGCFNPLPATIPVHLDHAMSAASVVARGRPYYVGSKLMIDATFASTPDAQQVRAKVKEGTLDSLSIVFRGTVWETIAGVRTCVKGELLAADIVSLPANTGARILSMRTMRTAYREVAREAVADALLVLARAQIAECKAAGLYRGRRGLARRRVDDLLAEALNPSVTDRFLRSL